MANLDKEKYEQIWNAALEYNRSLTEKSNHWAMDDADKEIYDAMLNVDGTGNMGFISIPRANINLPLYHGTNESVLQTSVGHIEGTSLPVGSVRSNEEDFNEVEYASHCVLSGHRGLPSARLFSDLDVMEVGDIFYLTILDQTLTYEVDEINIVEPGDSSKIEMVPGMDLVTLVTCTPYGINTHRLLIRGTRVANEAGELVVPAEAFRIPNYITIPAIGVPLLFITLVGLLIASGRRRPKLRKSDLYRMIEEVTESNPSAANRQSAARKTPDDIKPKDNPVKEPETKPESAEAETKPEPGNDPELSAEEPNHNAPENAPAGENEK